jgi:hypothetical protein
VSCARTALGVTGLVAVSVCAPMAGPVHADAHASAAAEAGGAATSQSGAHRILVMLRLSSDPFHPDAVDGHGYGDRQSKIIRQRRAEQVAHRHGLSLRGGGWAMPLIGLDCYVMVVSPGQSVDDVIARVANDPQVVLSQPMQTFRAERRSVDPRRLD